MGKYDHLLAPVTLAKTQFRNRIFASPVGLEYYPADNLHPGDDFIAFYEKKHRAGQQRSALAPQWQIMTVPLSARRSVWMILRR